MLVYTTAPLEVALHLFGAPEVRLYCATSAAAADLVVKLVRLQPSGEASFVCIGVARSSYLFPTAYACDTPQLWCFSLEPTSCIFDAGDRVRIEIAGSAYPLYDRNSGSAVDPRAADSWSWRRSTHIVFHDALHPSAI